MPPSSSDAPPRSAAFERLHSRVQRWIYDQRWTTLREVQEAAVEPILAGGDVVIAAATAGGKTEAAFLPICSAIIGQPAAGVQVLYVSPLKALINDQYDRLERLGERLDLAVHRWHGDVGTSAKRQVLREPHGILIITPESLEALFVGRGSEVRRLFAGLVYVVIDELHAFIGTERGRQLQSLLHRVELGIRRRVPRVALSATLGDMMLAAEFLRPGAPESVTLITATGEGAEVRLQLRGYRVAPPRDGKRVSGEQGVGDGALADSSTEADAGLAAIAEHLFQTLRGDDNLIFANSRTRVEAYADRLRRLSEERRVPNEFFPHHGSLSRELREDVEAMLRDRTRPVSVVCTTTLEMGIDIGDMKSIAQIGSPPSVASLRQRLGRSGRRGGPAVLRIYIEEDAPREDSPLQDALHVELVQATAMLQLLLASWYEPPSAGALHLSTLVQQTLSLIAQHGGVRADQAWRALCQGGPFSSVDVPTFTALLRCLGQCDLIQQAASGELLLGARGEQLVGHYSFFTAFTTPEEYQLFAGGRLLGNLPIAFPVDEGSHLIFAGRRWRVLAVDEPRRVIDLAPAAGGRVPRFSGGGGLVHDRVRRQMFDLYVSSEVPVFLDAAARDLLAEARAVFGRNGLAKRSLVERGRETLLLCWRGDRILDTIQVILQYRGVTVQRDGIALAALETRREELVATIREVVAGGVPDARTLAATVKNRRTEKYDGFLTDELMALEYASRHLDARGAWEALSDVLERDAELPPSRAQADTALQRESPDRVAADSAGQSPPPIRILWGLRDWADALAALPPEPPLPCRTAVVPRERVAHALRRRLLRTDRAAALAGTRFVTAPAAAIEVLRVTGAEFTPGEERLRRARLLTLFRAGVRLQYFSPELLASHPGWDHAFAGAIGDLESAGLRPADLRGVAPSATGVTTGLSDAHSAAARLRDVATIWTALDDAAGLSWTTARIYVEAARVLETGSGRWPFTGAVLATADISTTAAEARFLRAIPTVSLGILSARPVREHYVARLRTLFGMGASAVASAAPMSEHRTERDLLAAYLFATPEVLADPNRPRSSGPDGSVDLEEHAGIEAEIDATVDWVARQIQDETPLDEIAVLLPTLDPLAALVADRLARLPWHEGVVPVHVAGGVPLTGTAAGARALGVVRALRAHLAGQVLAEVLPALRSGTEGRHLSRGAAMRLAWSLGTAGGNPARPEDALEWSGRAARREAALREQIEAAATAAQADGLEDGERVRARDVEREASDLAAVRPALDALVSVARLVVTGAALAVIWPALRTFLETWLLQPDAGPRIHTLLDETLARVAADQQCGALAGDDALMLIEQALTSIRLPLGRFGEPAIYVGTVRDAVGLEFRAVRVIGLAEGHLPAPPREDPVLPDVLRPGLGAGGNGVAVTTTADRGLAALHAIDQVVRDTESRVAFSAPRMDLDRSQREPSSAILEAAAALGRSGAAGNAVPALIPDLTALRRDAFIPARKAMLAARRTRPIGMAAWLDAVAVRTLAPPPSWHGAPMIDLGRIRSLLDDSGASTLDGMLGAAAADLPVPGLTPERPISPSLLTRLLQCPHLFLLGTVLDLGEPEGAPPLREIGQPHYGGLLHRVAERFAREHGAAFGARGETLPIWLNHVDRIVDQEFARFIERYPLIGAAVSGRERERLRRDARELLEHDWTRPTPLRFVDAERVFGHPEALAVAAGPCTLYVRGRLDRIDVEGDLTLVRDFKTGRPHRRIRDEAEPMAVLDVQLAVYGLVARQLAHEWGTPSRVGVAYAYVNRGVEERAFRDDFATTLEPAAREWLALGADLLTRRAFPRTPDADDCTHCCFQPVCGDAAYDRAARLLAADPALAAFQRLKTTGEEDEED